MKTSNQDSALRTWAGLNDALRGCTEAQAEKLLASEMGGSRRRQFLLRIHSRLNFLRAARERVKLKAEAR